MGPKPLSPAHQEEEIPSARSVCYHGLAAPIELAVSVVQVRADVGMAVLLYGRCARDVSNSFKDVGRTLAVGWWHWLRGGGWEACQCLSQGCAPSKLLWVMAFLGELRLPEKECTRAQGQKRRQSKPSTPHF